MKCYLYIKSIKVHCYRKKKTLQSNIFCQNQCGFQANFSKSKPKYIERVTYSDQLELRPGMPEFKSVSVIHYANKLINKNKVGVLG